MSFQLLYLLNAIDEFYLEANWLLSYLLVYFISRDDWTQISGMCEKPMQMKVFIKFAIQCWQGFNISLIKKQTLEYKWHPMF